MTANTGLEIDAWIILAPDGRHVTIGRAAAPGEDDLADALTGLERLGFSGGWLATIGGSYYGRRPVRLAQVRPLGHPETTWTEAAEAFAVARRDGRTVIVGA